MFMQVSMKKRAT